MSARPNRRGSRPSIDVPPLTPPGELTPGERRHYRRLRQEYIDAGAVVVRATSALVVAAMAAEDLDRCREVAAPEPLLTTSHGQTIQHPAHKAVKDARKDYLAALGVLGLTPRSRSSARIAAKVLDANAAHNWQDDIDALMAGDDDPATACLKISRAGMEVDNGDTE